jgi:hypothetical protein
MASYVLGNILTSFVITNVNLVQFYIIMTTICFLASCFFLFLKPTDSHPTQESTMESVSEGSMLTIDASTSNIFAKKPSYIGDQTDMSEEAEAAKVVMIENRQSEITSNKEDTVRIKDIFRILSDRRYLKVVPMILVAAICVTGNSGILVPIMS